MAHEGPLSLGKCFCDQQNPSLGGAACRSEKTYSQRGALGTCAVHSGWWALVGLINWELGASQQPLLGTGQWQEVPAEEGWGKAGKENVLESCCSLTGEQHRQGLLLQELLAAAVLSASIPHAQ